MSAKHTPKYRVVRQGRQWGIADAAGNIVEGGFFYRDSALDKLAEWNSELTPRGGTEQREVTP